MSAEQGFDYTANNPFAAAWQDFFGKMQSAGVAPQQTPPDMAKQMQDAFFKAMSNYAEDFLRSDAFLTAMKQSMDNALSWQQSMQQYMEKGMEAAQMPTKADSEQIVAMVRGMEQRIGEKLDALSLRVENLEAAQAKAKRSAKS